MDTVIAVTVRRQSMHPGNVMHVKEAQGVGGTLEGSGD